MSSKPKLRLEIKTIKKCKQEELQKFECHIALKTSFYRPQRIWGKVIFSEACVKNSVHRGGACMAGGCVAGCVWQRGLHHRGGACMAGGPASQRGDMHGRGACVAGGGGMHDGWRAWQWGACVAGGGRAWQIL